MILLKDVTEDGIYPTNVNKRPWFITSKKVPYQVQTIYVWGVFDGASVQLQFSADGEEWFTPPNATWTSKTIANLSISAYFIRAVVNDAGVDTNLNLQVI